MGNNSKFASCIFLLVAVLDALNHGCVEGFRTIPPKPRGTIKTIEIPDEGDLMDCVDIYKQPAFDHDPLLKDIQLKPSAKMVRAFNITDSPRAKLIQNWHKYGVCPKGTVPIRRTTWNINGTLHREVRFDDPNTREYALAAAPPGIYFGASASFNVWKPRLEAGRGQLSLSQMWLVSHSGAPDQNTLETGWMVNPDLFRNAQTHFFTFWTRDNYQTTQCYNYQCGGFVHTNPKYALEMPLNPMPVVNGDQNVLGKPLSPISVYDGPQYDLHISIRKDPDTGNWWLDINYERIGFFRRECFTNLHNGATRVEFGGEIVNSRFGNSHTTTQMGSGHYANEGYGKASLIHNVEVVDSSYTSGSTTLSAIVTHPNCYNLLFGETTTTDWGSLFYFGGPGFSRQYCP